MFSLAGESRAARELRGMSDPYGNSQLTLPEQVRLEPGSRDISKTEIDYITAPAIEAGSGELLYEPISDKRVLLDRAKDIYDQLGAELKEQNYAAHRRAKNYGPISWDRFAENAEKWCGQGDFYSLSDFGIRVNSHWLNDIARSMLRNRPVEIEVAQTQRPAIGGNKQQGYHLDYSEQFQGQTVGLEFAKTLKRLQGGFEYTRPIITVDDLVFSNDKLSIDALHRWQTIKKAHSHLQQEGVITPDDVPGKDVIIIPRSRNAQRIDELIESLRESPRGMIVPFDNGQLYLRPYSEIQASVDHQYARYPQARRPEPSDILLVKANGEPTDEALDAASYLDPINSAFTHVKVSPAIEYLRNYSDPTQKSRKLSTVLQALDIIHADRDHNIYYYGRPARPEEYVYTLTAMLRHQMGIIIHQLEGFNDVAKAMKPEKYFRHNYYVEKMWPEDEQGIWVIGNEMPLHFRLGSIRSAAIIGYGPFSYPGLAVAPFLGEGARIDISDLLPRNISFAQEWYNGNSPQQHEVYTRFGDRFRAIPRAGRFYENCEQQLQQSGALRVAALEDLEPNSRQLIIESFVSCSNNIEKYGFYESVRQKARILEWGPDAMMVSVHMVNSGGWNNSGDDEGIKIPAAKLSIEDIEDGYRAAGMRIVKSVPLRADTALREDYKGMVVVFAKPNTLERPASVQQRYAPAA